MNDLDRLANKHGTDKGPKSHHYTKWYHQYFNSYRSRTFNLLELGWGGHEDPEQGGASARMWRDYFPNANVVVMDIEEKELTERDKGIHFVRGSQDDTELAKSLEEQFGPFDIIIDDASHLSSLTIKSFELYYPYLNPGGIYVVEDTHMAYHEHWYGKHEANMNPRKPTSTGAPTIMQFLETMADEVNCRDREGNGLDLFPKEYSKGFNLEWVHFYFNICFMRKRDGV